MKKDPTFEKRRRLSLTKKQLQEEQGAALLKLLNEIVADGALGNEEVHRLADWLIKNQGGDIPAIGYLIEVVKEIIDDGIISDSERLDLFLGIEKVMPVTDRGMSRERREQVEAEKGRRESSPSKIARADLKGMRDEGEKCGEVYFARRSWRQDQMTDAQRAFIRSLGGSITGRETKGEASDLIETLLGNKPISSRQQMVMRFWSRERQVNEGPREISEWMDTFYTEDPDRKLAWELFKNESEDNGLQGDPTRVPIGVGAQYLLRIKNGGSDAVPSFRVYRVEQNSGGRPKIVIDARPSAISYWIGGGFGVLAIAVVTFYAVVFLKKPNRYEPVSDPAVTTKISKPSVAPVLGGKTSETSSGAVDPAASRIFHDAVAQFKLSGIVVRAQEARVVIDGEMHREGDVIDSQLKISILRIEVEKKRVIFSDPAGNSSSRSLD